MVESLGGAKNSRRRADAVVCTKSSRGDRRAGFRIACSATRRSGLRARRAVAIGARQHGTLPSRSGTAEDGELRWPMPEFAARGLDRGLGDVAMETAIAMAASARKPR